MDPGVAAELKDAAERAGAASVSEYVEGALDARMAREQWLARLHIRPGAWTWPPPTVVDVVTTHPVNALWELTA